MSNLPYNSASRLRNVVSNFREAAQQLPKPHSRSVAVEKVLAFADTTKPHDKNQQVMSFLGDVNREISRVENELETKGVPSDLHKHTIKWLRTIFAMDAVSSNVDLPGLISNEQVRFLGWMSFVTPSDQTELDQAAVKDLADKVAALIAEVTTAEFSPTLSALLIEKLNSVLLAIRTYNVTGVEPVFWKFQTVAQEISSRSDQIQREAQGDEKKKSVLAKLFKVWETAHTEIQRTGATVTTVAGTYAITTQLLSWANG